MIERLKDALRRYSSQGVALAFSGGVDSSLLLAVLAGLCREKRFPVVAMYMHSIFQPGAELAEVEEIAGSHGVELKVFFGNPLEIPEVRNNPPRRCYWCKRHIFSEFIRFAESRGIGAVIDGTNADDGRSYRPGLEAIKELQVRSPLAELGFAKSDVRQLAAELGLRSASKPSAPCLATRFEYGTLLTPEALDRVGRGEALIRELLPEVRDVRLRVHGPCARLELSADQFDLAVESRRRLVDGLKQLGFKYVGLDLEGFRSGSMDEGLSR